MQTTNTHTHGASCHTHKPSYSTLFPAFDGMEGADSSNVSFWEQRWLDHSVPSSVKMFSPSQSRPNLGSSSRFPSVFDSLNTAGRSSKISPALDQFWRDVEKQFRRPLDAGQLQSASENLHVQFQEKLERSDICMLPSYQSSLPDGSERGTSLALDVGGSGMRVAWVQLNGRSHGSADATQILKRNDFTIDDSVRALPGRQFFEWMAKRICDAVHDDTDAARLVDHKPLPIGLSWSFPVDQISKRDATLLQMGKDFYACEDLIGENLGDLLEDACRTQGLDVAVHAIVNDSAAGLLSEMYVEESTTMAVLLGTGLNAAIHLPATALSAEKLGLRSTEASINVPNVLINTELSMFGKDVLATTQWDDALNLAHSHPDFQPLEHLTSGRYLGEIVRLIVVNAIQTAGLFDGEIPRNFEQYCLQTSTTAIMEGDTGPFIFLGASRFSALHPLPSRRSYTTDELRHVRQIIILVSDRAAAYIATAIHALWTLKQATDAEIPMPDATIRTDCISCLGSVLGKYPRFRERVQEWLDILTKSGDATEPGSLQQPSRIRLEMSDNDGDGALVGAAIAVALDG